MIYTADKISGGTVTRTVSYYPLGGAMRINISGGSNTLYYLLKDHLGSASVVTDASGTTVGEDRFYPYGETRFTTGTMYTDQLFTGQREMTGLGIYHYGARFYSPRLGRFLNPDTIVPDQFSPQDLNRFSYVRNNPLRYNDPTGHMATTDNGGGSCSVLHPCSTPGNGSTSNPSPTPPVQTPTSSTPSSTPSVVPTPTITGTNPPAYSPTNTYTPTSTSTPGPTNTSLPTDTPATPLYATPQTSTPPWGVESSTPVSTSETIPPTLAPTATPELVSDPLHSKLGPIGCALTAACDPNFGHGAPELPGTGAKGGLYGGGGGPQFKPWEIFLQ